MRRHIYIIAALVAMLMVACSRHVADKPVISVSIEPQRALLEMLVDTLYDINTVIPAGTNPESFEPSMSQRRALAESQLWFTVGTLPMEEVLEHGDLQVPMVDTSAGIARLESTCHHHHHGEEHHHGDDEGDPHLWTSLRNARLMAANMAAALEEYDPAHAQVYRQNLAKLQAHIDSIDAEVTQILADVPQGTSFAVWHPSLGYFARDYGLEQVAVGQENKESSAMQMRRAIDHARQANVAVFFFQREFDTRQAETANAAIGSKFVTIDPLSYSYAEELTKIAKIIAETAKNQSE